MPPPRSSCSGRHIQMIRKTKRTPRTSAGGKPYLNHVAQPMYWPVASSMKAAVVGLPTWAVRTPMDNAVPAMATMKSSPRISRLSSFAPNASPMPSRIGSMSSVRAVIEGTRNVSTTMTANTAQYVATLRPPTARSICSAMRRDSPVFSMAAAMTKPMTISQSEVLA